MKRLALCIGCNDYPGTGSDLAGCVNDAQDWTKALVARGFTVEMLLDNNVTKTNVVGELQRIIAQLRHGDRFVFQYSGHGSWVPDKDGDEPDGRDEVLVLHDFQNGGLLSDDELFDIFSRVPFGVRSLIVSDSCHSGTVSRVTNIDPLTPLDERRRVRFLAPAHFLDGAELDRARVAAVKPSRGTSRKTASLLSGCTDTEVSYDAWFNGRPNGALSRVALDRLASQPKSLGAWHKAIRQVLPSGQYPQSPQLSATMWQRRLPPFGG